MNYHPADPPVGSAIMDSEEYEFIELTNISTNSINLQNVAFTAGITFTFPAMSLVPGQHIVLAKNTTAFEARYGDSIPIAGVYSGNLSNSGERLVLVDGSGQTIHDFTFLDDDWIPAADGIGYSMVVVDSNAATSAWGTQAGWRRSASIHGSPGVADPPYLVGDYNGDFVVNAADYVVWRDTLGSTTDLRANGNDTNVAIDEGDYGVWKANFGESLGVGANSEEGAASSSLADGTQSPPSAAFDAAFSQLDEGNTASKAKRTSGRAGLPLSRDRDPLLLLTTSLAKLKRDDLVGSVAMGRDEQDNSGEEQCDFETEITDRLLAVWR
jgi:hypothetical protein